MKLNLSLKELVNVDKKNPETSDTHVIVQPLPPNQHMKD